MHTLPSPIDKFFWLVIMAGRTVMLGGQEFEALFRGQAASGLEITPYYNGG